jgi:hypothetical protein
MISYLGLISKLVARALFHYEVVSFIARSRAGGRTVWSTSWNNSACSFHIKQTPGIPSSWRNSVLLPVRLRATSLTPSESQNAPSSLCPQKSTLSLHKMNTRYNFFMTTSCAADCLFVRLKVSSLTRAAS